VRDLQSFTAFATANQPGVPIYFYGHSFGAVVALAAVKSSANPVRPAGVIIDSPALPLLLTRENYIKAVALMPFQGFRLPHLRMGAGPDKSPTGSERVNYQWLNSPDRLRIGYKIRYFVAAAKLGHDVRINCNEFDCPVLALAGDKDCVVAASDKAKKDYRRYLQEELCSGHAEVIMYPDGYHSMTLPETGDPRLDGTTRKVLTDITKWLDRRVRAESVSAAKIPKAVVGRVTH
jgi:alpha-beta hydrolase superfamily lysophospholipase